MKCLLKRLSIFLLILLLSECLFRGVVKFFFPTINARLYSRVSGLDPDNWKYKPHPFLQYIHEDILRLKKGPKDSLRIVCLGGSTTRDGYPEQLQEYLNAHFKEKKFEVINLGTPAYTSLHDLIMFMLYGLDLDPDYFIFMEGWNDAVTRDFPDFRRDYSHALGAFKKAVPWDAPLMRLSFLYNAGRWFFSQRDLYLEEQMQIDPNHPRHYENLKELEPFRKNVELMIQLAINKKIIPVLVTQPYSLAPGVVEATDVPHFKQANTMLTAIAKKYFPKVLFVDLSKEMSGKYDTLFQDVGHLKPEGVALKVKFIGTVLTDALLVHRKTLQKK